MIPQYAGIHHIKRFYLICLTYPTIAVNINFITQICIIFFFFFLFIYLFNYLSLFSLNLCIKVHFRQHLSLRFFVCGLSSQLRVFHSYKDVTITGERLQILSYARHLCPFKSEGSKACHIYCNTGHPF